MSSAMPTATARRLCPAAVFLREVTAQDVLEVTDKLAQEGQS